ncbi:MAG: hypothetical protein HWE13_04995 [Gammaproteobacteria bacterium]|nr:hypothetical protein [Gammaproteobacteria bacterium]NVK87457.1 hypothetical protein [Gammaproteobacteria bacterium]
MQPRASKQNLTDVNALANLIGVDLTSGEASEKLPKWRRLEILRELKELREYMADFEH